MLLLALVVAELVAGASLLSGQTTDEEEENALRALGYISHPSESKKDKKARKTGLVINRRRAVAPGYTLMTAIPEAKAILVDTEGKTVREWRAEDSRQWGRAMLLEGGDLLVIGKVEKSQEEPSRAARGKKAPKLDPLDGKPWFPKPDGGYLARYAWDGTLKWRRGVVLHHDLEVLPDGRIMSLGLSGRTEDGLFFQDHDIMILSPTGETLKTYSLFDLLTSNPGLFELPRTTDHPNALRQGKLDLLHSNAVKQMPFETLRQRGGIYCETCVLVTVRHQHLVAVVDLEREILLWVWGPGELQFPHEGQWLENGNVLIFDNGSEKRKHSRIVEVEPSSGKIVWSYMAKKPRNFFTAGRGTSQSLPNGNVLIASSNQGKVFEVTRKGRVVWRYFLRGENGKLLAMRTAKYPPSLVDPLLEADHRAAADTPEAKAPGEAGR